MLDRKIYQLYAEGREISLFLRDQNRWIEAARVVGLEGDLVTVRYELEEDDEVSSWEEVIRLESIGSISQKLASVVRGEIELPISDECPEAEQIPPHRPDSSQE